MAQTEGEKEIVLGNKQLISLFFVVVALLGVFFAAGYLIGRKSVSPMPAVAASENTGGPTGSPASQESEPPKETVAESRPATPNTPAQTPPVETAPVRTETPVERDADTSVKKAKADPAVTKLEAGATYLQVTALHHPDADNVVRSLREQNFPATLTDSPKEGFYRVLVGPYHEMSKVAEAKSRLKALGFANAYVLH